MVLDKQKEDHVDLRRVFSGESAKQCVTPISAEATKFIEGPVHDDIALDQREAIVNQSWELAETELEFLVKEYLPSEIDWLSSRSTLSSGTRRQKFYEEFQKATKVENWEEVGSGSMWRFPNEEDQSFYRCVGIKEGYLRGRVAYNKEEKPIGVVLGVA